MIIPKQVQLVINQLKKHHFEAYIVGGAVRDFLLGKTPSDFDVATNALPQQMKEIFTKFKVIESGIKHGTLTVIANHMAIEVTTYRIESEYLDFRRPNKVEFVNKLYLDLSRRDFTINALAYDNGFVDYFNGLNDLNNHIIRCVGNPNERFEEDALRILRALRFACQLDFHIESQTKQAIFAHIHLLSHIAVERIMVECNHMLVQNFTNVWPEYQAVFHHIIPELMPFDAEPIALRINNVDPVLPLRLAMLLLDVASPQNVLMRLKYPNRIQKQVTTIIKYAKTTISPTKIGIKKLLRYVEPADLFYIIELQKALGNLVDDLPMINQALEEPYRLSHLAINGHDLKVLKIKKNKMSQILNDVLTLIIEEKLKNDKTTIIDYVKQSMINEKDAND